MKYFFDKYKIIKIVFNIVDAPYSLEGAKTISDVEGDLTIYIENNIFFEEENILLLEFAIILNRWLQDIKNNEFKDFYYESMDYEDQPILEFTHNKEKKYSVSSVWQKFRNDNDNLVDLIELVKAASNYIEKLKQKLINKFNLDISDLLN